MIGRKKLRERIEDRAGNEHEQEDEASVEVEAAAEKRGPEKPAEQSGADKVGREKES